MLISPIAVLTEQNDLDFVVEDKHESTASTTENVGEGSLEESIRAFLLSDLDPAIDSVLVHNIASLAARLHHHTTTHRIERIRNNARDGRDDLSDRPGDDNVRVLRVGQHSFGCVEEAKVSSSVDDDTLDGHTEATVQTDDTVRLGDLLQTVDKTGELTFTSSFANIGAETGTSEVERIHETQRGCSSSTTGCEVTSEIAPELSLLVDATKENLLVLVLEGKVQRLGREVPEKHTLPQEGNTRGTNHT